MKKVFLWGLIFVATQIQAHEFKLGNLVIHHPYSRATVPGATNGAVFATIDNNGDVPEKLISATSSVSMTQELHTHIMVNGVAKMREVPAIVIPAHSSVALKPGSFHIMLMELNAPLKEGESFNAKLKFEKAGVVDVKVSVEGLGAMH